MEIKYTKHFADSLAQIIGYWQNDLKIAPEKVAQFTNHIHYKINLLQEFPQMGTDVTKLYDLKTTTYRILIGKQYGIFYRIDGSHDVIVVGTIFSISQMRIKFS